jgi:hypothetical protein
MAVVLVYIDDLIIVGYLEDVIMQSKEHMYIGFKMKALGKLRYFLGLEVEYLVVNVILQQGSIL